MSDTAHAASTAATMPRCRADRQQEQGEDHIDVSFNGNRPHRIIDFGEPIHAPILDQKEVREDDWGRHRQRDIPADA